MTVQLSEIPGSFLEQTDALRTLAVPLLNTMLFGSAAVLVHKPQWRRYADWQLVLIIPIGAQALHRATH